MESWLPRHRITVDDYYRMAEAGLLAEDARVELIEGEIFDMAPIGSRHSGVVSKLTYLLSRAIGDRAMLRVQQPIRLSRSSEPQPDLALVRPRSDFYARSHPTASDTLLVIEVSETTLRYDQLIKAPLYAAHAIPELWIIDLEGAQMHVFRSPEAERYRDVSSASEPGMTVLVADSSIVIDLTGLLKV
jgi:Uma2 family endonuclease